MSRKHYTAVEANLGRSSIRKMIELMGKSILDIQKSSMSKKQKKTRNNNIGDEETINTLE
jgi:hypothetical protein